MAEGDEVAVRLEGVGLQLPDGRWLLKDVSFSLEPGRTLVLIGTSGSGKTTLLKLINGLIAATVGRIEVLGRTVELWDPILLRRKIGYVIQEIGLFPHFTVERNVALVPTLLGWHDGKIRARCRELLAMLGLDPEVYSERFPHQLSGGQRQRVGVARALAAEPPLMLLDEPFGALDPLTRSEIQREFKQLKQRLHKTMIFVTHDIREALIIGDRIGLVENGRLLTMCTPAELMSSTASEFAPYRQAIALPQPG